MNEEKFGSFCLPKTNVYARAFAFHEIVHFTFRLFFEISPKAHDVCVFNNMVPNYQFLCPYSEFCFCFFFSRLLVTLSPCCFLFRYYFSRICSYIYIFFFSFFLLLFVPMFFSCFFLFRSRYTILFSSSSFSL